MALNKTIAHWKTIPLSSIKFVNCSADAKSPEAEPQEAEQIKTPEKSYIDTLKERFVKPLHAGSSTEAHILQAVVMNDYMLSFATTVCNSNRSIDHIAIDICQELQYHFTVEQLNLINSKAIICKPNWENIVNVFKGNQNDSR